MHIAIILGPGHSFTGIVTLEDLVEEVVGEIQDEQDPEEIPPSLRNPDGSFEADGRLTLDVAARDLGLKFPPLPPAIETLGGYVNSLLEELPIPGDPVDASGFRLTVLEVRDRRIRRLKGTPCRRKNQLNSDQKPDTQSRRFTGPGSSTGRAMD